MVCLFSYGSLLVNPSINFPPLRSFMDANNRVHPFMSTNGVHIRAQAYYLPQSRVIACEPEDTVSMPSCFFILLQGAYNETVIRI